MKTSVLAVLCCVLFTGLFAPSPVQAQQSIKNLGNNLAEICNLDRFGNSTGCYRRQLDCYQARSVRFPTTPGCRDVLNSTNRNTNRNYNYGGTNSQINPKEALGAAAAILLLCAITKQCGN